MKKYIVHLPITGVISVEVEAENEEDAERIAFEDKSFTTDDITEFDWVEKIVEGNVFYGLLNETFIEDLGDVED